MWFVAVVLGVLTVVSGALSPRDAGAELLLVAPVLVFLVAVTALADLAQDAQVFEVAAWRAARAGRGHVRGLFLLVCGLGAVTTVVLSLDTTAVLLTPVVLAVATDCRLAARPFAFAAVWLANTASLLLPVSNLTNLLALRRLDIDASGFAGRMLLPEVVAVVMAVTVLGLRYRGQLRGSYAVPARPLVRDRPLLRAATGACLLLGPLTLAGVPAYAAALASLTVVGGAFVVRRRSALQLTLLPWRLVLLVMGLFVVVTALGQHGLDPLVARLAGDSTGPGGALRTAATAAISSNVLDNLPAYLVLERAVRPEQLFAVLVGVNVGPLVTVWGSLATLLWRERCRAAGLQVSVWEFATLGLVGMPIVLVATALVLTVR